MTTPSYATVTLVCAEDAIPSAASSSSLCKTMRVPVDARTTIRELAKAAMTRFVHSLRRTASSSDLITRQLCRSGIIVTDVHLRAYGGDAATTAAMSAATAQTSVLSSASSQSSLTRCGSPLTPSKIELFSDDCVTQVVQVREEVVYMTFRAASEHRSKKKPAEPAAESKGVSDVQASSVPQADRTSAQPAENAVPPSVTPFDVTRMLAEHSTTTGHITEEEVFCSGPEDLGKDGISMSVPVPARVDALPIKAADKSGLLSPHNQSTLPPDSALPHTTRSKAVRPSSPSLALSSTSDSSSNNDSDSDSDDNDDAEEEEAISIARSIATLRQAETRRMPWGPDAHKHFATNYVNSPHKILRGRYNAKRQLLPPPPVKLNATEKAPRAASSTGAKAISATGSERPEGSAKSGAKRSAERVATPSPSRKMKRTESLSSSEHSQVSVTMSCGASSESPSPHRRAASGTRSQLFSPGHGTTTVTQVAAAVASVDKEPESSMTVHEAPAQANVAPPLPPLPSPPSPAAAVSDTQTGAVITASFTPLEKMTPSEAVSQAEPSTIAKPVQSFAVRQLSFEDNSGHDASKAPSLLTSPVAPPVPAVQVVSVEHRLPPPVL